MLIPFTKMSGAGNDFIVIDNRAGIIEDPPQFARQVSDRRSGIGADGILLLENSTQADYRMNYFNADGSYGGMCGNGGRCIAVYAAKAGLVPGSHSFEALGHIYTADIDTDGVTLHMTDPHDMKLSLKLSVGGIEVKCHFVHTGSPHVVIDIDEQRDWTGDLGSIDVEALGRQIRLHEAFKPDGTNVNFVKRRGERDLQIRTYERGVEAETLACGTGSVAAAIIGRKIWKLGLPVRVDPRGNESLLVSFEEYGEDVVNVTLKGPAIITFRGEMEYPG